MKQLKTLLQNLNYKSPKEQKLIGGDSILKEIDEDYLASDDFEITLFEFKPKLKRKIQEIDLKKKHNKNIKLI